MQDLGKMQVLCLRLRLESRLESLEKENSKLKADVRALEGDFQRLRKELGLAQESHCCSYWLAKNPDDVKNCKLEGRGRCTQFTTNADVKEFGTAGDSACDDSTPACS